MGLLTKTVVFMGCLTVSTLYADKLRVPMYGPDHKDHGWVEFEDARDKGLGKGLLINLNLYNLPPNAPHGFHIHECGRCDSGQATTGEASSSQAMSQGSQHSQAMPQSSQPPQAMPQGQGPSMQGSASCNNSGTTPPGDFMTAMGHAGTGTHQGPYGNGHWGDLPLISSDKEGRANYSVIAPRINSVEDLLGHAVMLHGGGDTYTDPPTLGGGGPRIACGVIMRENQNQRRDRGGWRFWNWGR